MCIRITNLGIKNLVLPLLLLVLVLIHAAPAAVSIDNSLTPETFYLLEDTSFSLVLVETSHDSYNYYTEGNLLQEQRAKNSLALRKSLAKGENRNFSVRIAKRPNHGIVSGNANRIKYTPTRDFHGNDSFIFYINGKNGQSETARVLVSVISHNDVPLAFDSEFETLQDIPVRVRLEASDIDKNPLTYTIISSPLMGSLHGTAPDFVYLPKVGFWGTDSFTFKVNDGTLDSSLARVTVEVRKPEPLLTESNSSEPVLNEGFIKLHTGRKRTVSFYRVMLDSKEQPYLDIEELLMKQLDLMPGCRIEQHYCQTRLHVLNRSFWIDGKKLKSGNSGSGMVAHDLPANILIKKEHKLWLRFDYWEKWLPVETTWDMMNFQLNLIPSFPLLDEMAKKRQQSRMAAYRHQEKIEELNQEPAIVPKAAFRPELRYRLNHSRHFNKYDHETSLSTDFNADLWQGTFQISENLVFSQSSEDEAVRSFSFWHYKRYNNQVFKRFEIGHLYLESTPLIPSMLIANGLLLNRLGQKTGSDNLGLKGITIPGTEVDLYFNGFLMASTVVGENGSYLFQDHLVPGGELVRLQFYFPDGSSEEKSFLIAPDKGRVIPAHEWDMQLSSGELENQQISHLDLSFGLRENFSLGIQAYKLLDGKTEKDISGLFFAWRPFFGMYLLGEHLAYKESKDYGLNLDITWLNPHIFKIETRYLDAESPLRSLYADERKTTAYHSIHHSLGIGQWLWLAEYVETKELRKLNLNLRYTILPTLAVFLNPEYTSTTSDSIESNYEIGGEVTSEHHNLRLQHFLGETGKRWILGYRYSGKKASNWDVYVSLTQSQEEVLLDDQNQPTKEGITIQAGISWRPFQGVRTGVVYQDAASAWGAWSDIIANDPGPASWDEFGTGTLSGKVISPPISGKKGVPLRGVVISAGSLKGITDKNGEYIITGLPVEQRLEVTVDSSTLDIGLMPAKENNVVFFRAGTHIELNPVIERKVGIDGYLEDSFSFDGKSFTRLYRDFLTLTKKMKSRSDQEGIIPANVYIEAVQLPDKKIVARGAVESDGFFVLEGLAPGSFFLQTKGLDNPPPPFLLEISKDQSWISNLIIQLK